MNYKEKNKFVTRGFSRKKDWQKELEIIPKPAGGKYPDETGDKPGIHLCIS
jgi:hypothetical protein